MKITKGDKSIEVSSWEISVIAGVVTASVCSISNVIRKNKKKRKKLNKE